MSGTLADAARYGSVALVDAALQAGADPNVGWPLAWATHLGFDDVVKRLLADARTDATEGGAFVSWKRTCDTGTLDVLQCFLAKPGFDPSAANNYAMAAAGRLGQADALQCLLDDSRADAAVALKEAVKAGSTDCVRMLLGAVQPAGVMDGDEDAFGALNLVAIACKHGHADVVRLLLADGRVDPGANDDAALREASMHGHTDVVRLLLADARVNPLGDGLIHASGAGHTDIVRALLEDGRANSHACNWALTEACKRGHVEVVRLLLGVASRPQPGFLAAVACGFSDIVEAFLANGSVDPSQDDNNALRMAYYCGPYARIIRLLLADARVQATWDYSRTSDLDARAQTTWGRGRPLFYF